MRKFICLSVMFFAGVVFLCGAPAASAWEKGSVKVVPSVKYDQQWDSNIFLESNKEKSDFISILSPGIYGEAGFGGNDKHKARVNYVVDLGYFSEYHSQNYGNHNLFGEVDLDLNDYSFRTYDNFLFTSSRAGTDQDTRNLRKENTIGAVAGAEFNKLAFDVGYSNYIVDYLSNSLKSLDRFDNSLWTTGYVRIAPKTQILTEYKYTNLYYPSKSASGRSGNANSAMVGVKGEITSKITGIAKAGYKYQDYKNGEHYSAPVANVSLDYKATERAKILFAYDRDAMESSYTDSNFYASDRFTTDLKYDLGRSFVGRLTGLYARHAYDKRQIDEPKKRTDNIFGVGGGLDYYWKEWAVCGIGYDYNQRESTIDNRDYDQHILSANIKLMY